MKIIYKILLDTGKVLSLSFFFAGILNEDYYYCLSLFFPSPVSIIKHFRISMNMIFFQSFSWLLEEGAKPLLHCRLAKATWNRRIHLCIQEIALLFIHVDKAIEFFPPELVLFDIHTVCALKAQPSALLFSLPGPVPHLLLQMIVIPQKPSISPGWTGDTFNTFSNCLGQIAFSFN